MRPQSVASYWRGTELVGLGHTDPTLDEHHHSKKLAIATMSKMAGDKGKRLFTRGPLPEDNDKCK